MRGARLRRFWLAVRLRFGRRSFGARFNGLRSCRRNRLNGWPLFDAHDILVRHFPAEVLLLPALFVMLFQKDRTPGIGNQCSHRGQAYITSAIVHFDTTPKEE